MRKILLIMLMLTTSSAFSQKYNYEAAFAGGTIVKMTGSIVINDTILKVISISNEKESTNNYQVTKKVNNIIYFTDGVITQSLSFTYKKGKMKGFEYDVLIIWTTNINKDSPTLMFYANLENE